MYIYLQGSIDRKEENMSVLVCENISFSKNNNEIITDFNFNFLENKVYSLIGRKHSGKTTLLKLFSGQLSPTEGNIFLDGQILSLNTKINNRICFLASDLTLPKHLTIKQIFALMARYYPKWDRSYAHKLVDYFNIELKSRFFQLRNDRKSLLIGILGLASRANITIFDEPARTADAKDRYDFFNFLYEHFAIYPRTFILSTNYIDEIEFAIDEVLFIDDGKLIDHYIVSELKENFTYLSGKTEVLRSLISGVKIIGYEERGNELFVCVRQRLTRDDVRKYKKYLIKISEVPIQKVYIHLINLRDIKGI